MAQLEQPAVEEGGEPVRLSPEQTFHIFGDVVGVKKGRRFGMGSCATSASPEYVLRRPGDTHKSAEDFEELLRERDERHAREMAQMREEMREEFRRELEETRIREEEARRQMEETRTREDEARYAHLESLLLQRGVRPPPAGTPLAGLMPETILGSRPTSTPSSSRPPFTSGSRGGRQGSRRS